MGGGATLMFTSVETVSVRLGREITDRAEILQVEAWIGDVEAMVASRLPDLAERVEAGFPPASVVAAVIANAVIRKIKNPDGKQNERIDDYSYGYTTDAARGELFLTEEEWALLSPGETSGGAFSIRPYTHRSRRGAWVTPSWWVPAP